MSILLTLNNLNLTFGQKMIFDSAELTINKGDRIGLIGLNGHGKSTLFKIITTQVSPGLSTPPFSYDKSTVPFDIFLVPQELNITDFGNLSIENYYLAFYPDLYELHLLMENEPENIKHFQKFETLKGWDIQNNYVNYLKGFHLDDLHRQVRLLSGGEQRKMALSIGLSSMAELVLWDEPTNHLDTETIERFEEELLSSNKTYMIISHDRYLLNSTTDRICHIERGKITNFKGTYLDYLDYLQEKEEELKKNLDKLENNYRRELAWMRQGIKARGTRSKKRVEGFHSIKDSIAEFKERKKKSVELELMHSGKKSKILVSIKEGAFSYQSKDLLKDLNLVVAKDHKIALIGPNGAGKSTLIKLLQGHLTLRSGELKKSDNLKVIVFEQNRAGLDENKTPMDLLRDGSDFITLPDGRKKHINSYLSGFLFDSNQVNRPVSTLSGGEKNRLQLAMFMKQSADLWIFDEPTNDLDIETIELLERELHSYQAAVIIISHDRAFLDNTCNTTWLINDQTIEVFTGGYTQVAPYLEALEIQRTQQSQQLLTIEKERSLQKEKEKEKEKEKVKLGHHEKKRLEVIESEIMNAENRYQELMKCMDQFDFSSMNQSKQEEFSRLDQQKGHWEQQIEQLYKEWDELNQKQIDSSK